MFSSFVSGGLDDDDHDDDDHDDDDHNDGGDQDSNGDYIESDDE